MSLLLFSCNRKSFIEDAFKYERNCKSTDYSPSGDSIQVAQEVQGRTIKSDMINIKLKFIFFTKNRKVSLQFAKETDRQVKTSVGVMNDMFKGKINFVYSRHYDYYPGYKKSIQDWIDASRKWTYDFEEYDDEVLVFVTHTNTSLNGFTPVLPNGLERYEQYAPLLDKIYLSYRSLDRATTLSHEMGHFFGLNHTWEVVNKKDINMLQLTNDKVKCVNLMSYSCYRDSFTDGQISSMINFLVKYKSYLIY